MLSGIDSISAGSIPLLFGTTGKAAATSDNVAHKLLSDATGNTDDVFKAGNAIGSIIEIVSRMKHSAASAGEKVVEQIDLPNGEGRKLWEFDGDGRWYAMKGTFTTVSYGNDERTETFVGTAQWQTDEAYRGRQIGFLKQDQSTIQNRTMLAAFKNGTMQEFDIAELGFKTGMTMTYEQYADGSATGSIRFDVSGVTQLRDQYTEVRDGVLHDKATGKFAAIGQNGSKFIYYIW